MGTDKLTRSGSKQPVTDRQKKLLRNIIKKGVTEAGRRAGYSCKQASNIAYHSLMRRAGLAMIDVGYPVDRLLTEDLLPLLKATETRFFQSGGVVMETREVAALDIRLRAGLGLLGAYDAAARDAERTDHPEFQVGGPTVNLVITEPGVAAAIAERLSGIGRYSGQPVLDVPVDENAG